VQPSRPAEPRVPVIDPSQAFPGTVAFTVPHMDDCVLACGATIAKLPDKHRLHVVYATDGMRSPAPILPWRDAASPDLGQVRKGEALAAMEHLGIPGGNVRFLDLPDSRLARCESELERVLSEFLENLEPRWVFTPFRYDRHPDHLALNRAVSRIVARQRWTTEIVEYFVYHYWRLIPGGDVRKYVRPGFLVRVDPGSNRALKRAALDRFASQTTRFYPWQTRPNLTPELLDAVSREPEMFLLSGETAPGTKVFERLVPWIVVAHRLEPWLKVGKDRLLAVARRIAGGSAAR